MPGFWRFDAMTSYKIGPKTLLQLNIYNITDELYYAQYYQGHAVPAAGSLCLALAADALVATHRIYACRPAFARPPAHAGRRFCEELPFCA